MKSPKNIVILIWFTMLIISCSSNRENQITNTFSPYTGNNPGASIMVIKNGNVLLAKTYGLANLEKKIPVTLETNFRLASVSKQFTAMSILMLIEQGKLNYETTLKDIFPEFPEYGKKITITHLMQHTSGLIDYETLMDENDTTQVLDIDVLNMIMEVDSTYFEPGTNYKYSNSGYAVLAMIVEKISGKKYSQFLKENIFQPLRMENTVAYEKGFSEVKYRAYGYRLKDGQFIFSDQSPTSAVLGDGGIYSSIVDLYKWDQALYTNKLISYQTFEKAVTPGNLFLSDGSPMKYGFGWQIDEYKGHKRYYHTGSTCGFLTVIERYPDDKFTVIILTNRAGEDSVMWIADKLTDVFLIEEGVY